MLRSPMAEESVLRTESKPGMARSATSAPRSAGCSYARELMSGNRMRPRRAGRDSGGHAQQRTCARLVSCGSVPVLERCR